MNIYIILNIFYYYIIYSLLYNQYIINYNSRRNKINYYKEGKINENKLFRSRTSSVDDMFWN